MWLFDLLSGRLALWRKVTDQRLQNQQGDLLRIEQKLDDIDFRLHQTLGEQCGRLDDAAITVGALACDVAREAKHTNVVGTAGELILSTIRVLRDRIEKLEQRADEADQQIAALLKWGHAIDWAAGNKDLPRRVDHSDRIPRPVFDQGQLGAAAPLYVI
jgi:hypothetical protein